MTTTSTDPGDDPEVPTLAALRGCVQRRTELERDLSALVRRARTDGFSWAQIAQALGVTRQAVHRKYGGSRFSRE